MVSTARTPAQVSKPVPHTHTEGRGAQVTGARQGQGQEDRATMAGEASSACTRRKPAWRAAPGRVPAPKGSKADTLPGPPQANSGVRVWKSPRWAPTPDSTQPTGAGPLPFPPGLKGPGSPHPQEVASGLEGARCHGDPLGAQHAPLPVPPPAHAIRHPPLLGQGLRPRVPEEGSRHRGRYPPQPLLGRTTSGGPPSASTPQPPPSASSLWTELGTGSKFTGSRVATLQGLWVAGSPG